jgi:serum/glucocorticoid-regulated kinase 2
MQFSPKLQDLLKKLLKKDPNARLGHNGSKEIRDHPWFEKLNWDNLLNKKIKAPFMPKLSSDIDITNFDVEFTSCSVESKGDNKSPEFETNDKFRDFSYEE